MFMHPYISHEIARARQRDLLEDAGRQRLAGRLRARPGTKRRPRWPGLGLGAGRGGRSGVGRGPGWVQRRPRRRDWRKCRQGQRRCCPCQIR